MCTYYVPVTALSAKDAVATKAQSKLPLPSFCPRMYREAPEKLTVHVHVVGGDKVTEERIQQRSRLRYSKRARLCLWRGRTSRGRWQGPTGGDTGT